MRKLILAAIVGNERDDGQWRDGDGGAYYHRQSGH